MSFRKSVSRILLGFCLFLLAPSLLFANSATVDCTGLTAGAFTKIQDAINSLPHAGPNNITVLPCNYAEHLFIVTFTDLSISATPGTVTVTLPATAARLLNITDSTKISIDGLNFTGGRGVLVNNSTDVFIADGSITNSGGQGMISLNSVVDV